MSFRVIVVSIFVLVVILQPSASTAAPPPAGVPFSSFIDLVLKTRTGDRQDVVDRYFETRSTDGFPVVEGTEVHFLYRSSDVTDVSVPGDFNGWDKDRDTMKRIEGTDLFYLTKIFEADARLDYKFVLDGERWVLDPLNPATVRGGFGPNSEVSLPSYVQPEEIRPGDDIPRGVLESFTFESASTGNTRQVQVYLPPGYDDDESRRWPSLYVNDGGEYISLGSMDRVLDYLAGSGDIDGIIAIFVDPVDRNSEYRQNPEYERMIVDELVPMIDARYRTDDDPGSRGMMGASLGGLISVDICYGNPGLFGLCGSQSGAFYPEDRGVIGEIAAGPKRDLRFYLDWGTYEPGIRSMNIRMLDVMKRRGYEVTSFEYHEGHSWGSWRAHLDDLLMALYGESR